MYQTNKTYTCLAIVLLCGLSAASEALAQEAKAEAAVAPPRPKSPPVLARSPGHPVWSQGKSHRNAPALDVQALIREDETRRETGPMRIGAMQAVGIDSRKDGQWVQLENGQWMWVLSIAAPGARGLRIEVSPWNPPAGGELVVYNADRPEEAHGPYTARDGTVGRALWTATAFAEDLRIEYCLPPGADHLADAMQLSIPRIGRLYRGLGGEAGLMEFPCHLDVMCYPAWTSDADGVGVLSYNTPTGYWFACTGSLLNRIPQDLTPFFATATHCGVDPTNVETVEIFWFYQTNACNGTVPSIWSVPRTVAQFVLVRDAYTDWTLLVLREQLPGNVSLLGWDPDHLNDWSSLTCIHHPGGTHKRISFGTKFGDYGSRPNPSNPGATCLSGTAYYVAWNQGLVEHGSSGSPILDNNHKVRGVMSCFVADCTDLGHASYGRLDAAWPFVSPWLMPADPIYVDGAFSGTELGTATNPFNSVQEGTAAVIRNSTVYVQDGTYDVSVVIEKDMTVRPWSGIARIVGQ